MTASEHVASGNEVPPPLSFQRTVDRSLVHRSSIGEVFVADSAVLSDTRCLVGVQLPLTHGYYNDTTAHPARHDPLLLLESSRQAAIYGSHWLMGLRLASAMVVASFSLRLPNSGSTLVGTCPGDMTVDTTYQGKPTKRGRVRNAGVVQELHIGGTHIGTHEMNLTIVTDSENEALRSFQRGSAPPSTSDYAGFFPGERVHPHQVGRYDPRNVVLSNLCGTGTATSATVAPDFGNKALFDHAYDHLPAMVLTEAARQLALAAADDGSGAVLEQHAITGISASMQRYAELDEELTAEAVVRHHAEQVGAKWIDITFVQANAKVAEISLEIQLQGR